jgi:hypothetical protein
MIYFETFYIRHSREREHDIRLLFCTYTQCLWMIMTDTHVKIDM